MANAGEPLDWALHATELQRQLERFLSHLAAAKHRPPASADASWRPSIDMYEHEGQLVILADMGSAEPSETQVIVDSQSVTITGRRRPQRGPAGAVYHLMEIGGGYFDRVVQLPVSVEASRAKARLLAGVLEVTMPILPDRQSTSVKVRVSRSRRHAKQAIT